MIQFDQVETTYSIYIYIYWFSSTYQDLLKKDFCLPGTKGEDFKHPGELETSTCAIRLGCLASSGDETKAKKQTTNKEARSKQNNAGFLVSNISLFSPLFGEDYPI